MRHSSFKQMPLLLRFIVKQDRIRTPIWLIGLVLFTLLVPIAFADLYPEQAERDLMAETMKNPAMTAMVGPGDIAHYTIGAMTAHQMLLLTAVVVGFMNIFLVIRHTRTDEEEGRMELIRSLPVGRLAAIGAILIYMLFVNVVLAGLTGAGLYALQIESMGLQGSFLYGVALGAVGMVFATLATLFAQLTESARAATGLSIAILLTFYLMRAIGDVSMETLSYISPLRWLTDVKAYAGNDWQPIVWLLILAGILGAIAAYLHAIRDLEAGFFPSRPGRKHATTFLENPIGLALRLQRTGWIAWAVGMLLIGLSYGSVLGDLESFFSGNEMLEQILPEHAGYSLTEQFISMLMMVMSLIAAIPPLMAVLRLYGEEKKDRVAQLMNRPISRKHLLGSYVLLAIMNGWVMLSLSIIGLWSAGTTVTAGGLEFWSMYGAAMVYYPAIIAMIGLAVFLIGFIPGGNIIVWLYLFYSFFVLYLGGLFQFPEWLGKLTPFGYIPQLPMDQMEWLPMIALLGIALFLMVAGFQGYRRRDLQSH